MRRFDPGEAVPLHYLYLLSRSKGEPQSSQSLEALVQGFGFRV